MNAGLARASVAACVAAAVATLALMAWAASWSWSGLAFMVSLMAWCVSPYVPLGFASRKPRASRRSAIALLVTVVLVAAFAAIVYVDAFFIHLDAQGALVFLFVPVVQWVGALFGIVVAARLEPRGH